RLLPPLHSRRDPSLAHLECAGERLRDIAQLRVLSPGALRDWTSPIQPWRAAPGGRRRSGGRRPCVVAGGTREHAGYPALARADRLTGLDSVDEGHRDRGRERNAKYEANARD